MRIALIVLIVAVVFVLVRFWMMGRDSQRMNPQLGHSDSGFVPCPSSPNCVSSDASDEGHGAPIWSLAEGVDFERIASLVDSLENTQIISKRADYLHAEVTSGIFGFVDDLELALRDEGRSLAVRSASRVGYSDLGVNARRVAALEQQLRSREMIR